MNVTIVGAGLMGSGIAFVFLTAGHRVVLTDRSLPALESAQDRTCKIASLLEFDLELANLRLEHDLTLAAQQADLVIEAIVEDLSVKREVFATLSRAAPTDAILASNTSAIPIGEIAKVVSDASRVVGTHFWNPPWAIDLVEIVEAADTAPVVVDRLMQVFRDLEMTPVHVKRDVPGFIGNRLQHALKREAIALVEKGVADAETVDTVVKRGFGQRLAFLGPLEQSDMLGLDLTLRIHRTLMKDLDVTPRPAKLLEELVEFGDTGMSTGKGFRQWTPDEASGVKRRLSDSLREHGLSRLAKLTRSSQCGDGKSFL